MQNSKTNITSPEAMEDLFATVFQKGEEFLRPRWEKIEDKVRESPTKAVMIAAGIGYVLHRLPLRSLLATNMKLLWAFAPPAVMAMIAGKGLHALEGRVHSDGASRKASSSSTSSKRVQETAL